MMYNLITIFIKWVARVLWQRRAWVIWMLKQAGGLTILGMCLLQAWRVFEFVHRVLHRIRSDRKARIVTKVQVERVERGTYEVPTVVKNEDGTEAVEEEVPTTKEKGKIMVHPPRKRLVIRMIQELNRAGGRPNYVALRDPVVRQATKEGKKAYLVAWARDQRIGAAALSAGQIDDAIVGWLTPTPSDVRRAREEVNSLTLQREMEIREASSNPWWWKLYTTVVGSQAALLVAERTA